MSRASSPMPPISQVIENIIEDSDGAVLARFLAEEQIEKMPDGSLRLVKRGTSRALADGFIWNPANTQGPRPMHIGVCLLCQRPPYSFPVRRRPTAGLVTLATAKPCTGCGALTCPAHCRQDPEDGKWRCIGCVRRNRFKQFLKSLFFEKG